MGRRKKNAILENISKPTKDMSFIDKTPLHRVLRKYMVDILVANSTQTAISDRSGVPQNLLSEIKERTKNVTLFNLDKVRRARGRSVIDLLREVLHVAESMEGMEVRPQIRVSAKAYGSTKRGAINARISKEDLDLLDSIQQARLLRESGLSTRQILMRILEKPEDGQHSPDGEER